MRNRRSRVRQECSKCVLDSSSRSAQSHCTMNMRLIHCVVNL
jgi:hypothetical protein